MRLPRTALSVLLFVTTARGQGDPSLPLVPVPPIVTPLHIGRLGDIGGPGDDRSALSPVLWSTPLRLTLMSDLVPIGRFFPECEPLGDPSGNSIQGFALQRSAFLRLTPALTLHGFSSAGCPVDAAAGGGVTQTIELRSHLWLVASAGMYVQPAIPGLRPAWIESTAGIDLAKQRDDNGNALWMGVGAASRAPRGVRLRFGGSF
jgi:hypothetical protein